MAELTLGAIGIAGLFNNALECFNLARVGQNFDRDIETYQARLRLLQISLSQWGSAIGLDDISDGAQLDHLSAESRHTAERALRQIMQLFEDVEKKSVAQGRRATESDFSARMKEMCGKMRNISMSRKNKDVETSFMTKAKWAITGREEFDKLVSDISGLINGLIAAFPAPAKKKLEDLCQKDAAVLCETDRDGDVFALLKDALGENNALLKNELSKLSGSTVHNNQSTIHGDNNRGLIQGTNHAPMNNTFGG